MPCTATSPATTPPEFGRYLASHIPPSLFRGEGLDESTIAWRIAPEPFALSPAHVAEITSLGDDLLAFYRALSALYVRSARGSVPAFVADYLDQGKPDHIVRLARQNRFKSDVPSVIRPDLILTENGFIASELDSIPGGMGFVGARARTFC